MTETECIYLREGDTWENGDEYGVGFCFVIGNRSQTGITAGDKVHAQVMCYKPRRKIKQTYTRNFNNLIIEDD